MEFGDDRIRATQLHVVISQFSYFNFRECKHIHTQCMLHIWLNTYPHTETKHINTIALSSSFALMKREKSSHRITDMPRVITLLYFIYFHLQTLIFLFIYRVCQTQSIQACSLLITARVHRSALWNAVRGNHAIFVSQESRENDLPSMSFVEKMLKKHSTFELNARPQF